MWIFSKLGFFSAVQNKRNQDLIHIRSQFAGDLEKLLCKYSIATDVVATPCGDYQYRCDIPREKFSEIMSQEALEIDYDKFKPAVHDGSSRDNAYAEVFSCMMSYGLQNN